MTGCREPRQPSSPDQKLRRLGLDASDFTADEPVCLSAQNSTAANATKTTITATLTITASAGISHVPR